MSLSGTGLIHIKETSNSKDIDDQLNFYSSHNITLCGQYIFWAVEATFQQWIRALSKNDLVIVVQIAEFISDTDKRGHLMDLVSAQRNSGIQGKQSIILIVVETKKGADSLEHWLCVNDLIS